MTIRFFMYLIFTAVPRLLLVRRFVFHLTRACHRQDLRLFFSFVDLHADKLIDGDFVKRLRQREKDLSSL